jgi:hypothetical protein
LVRVDAPTETLYIPAMRRQALPGVQHSGEGGKLRKLMDGQAQDNPEQPPTSANRRWDWGLVAVLLLLALSLRGWLMAHTEVLARDSIGFIRFALEFESDDWQQVVRNNHQHPGYPLTVLLVSIPVRAVADADARPADVMAFSAQLASNLAAVLLVIPMFYLGKLLFHRPAGFGAALLFQFWPVSAHLLSDGLSEPLFLLLTCTALVFAVQAVRSGSPWQFAWCGAFGGLAYLTRPEGLLVVVATLVVLLGLQRSLHYRRSWGQVLLGGSCLTVAALLASSPYLAVTHHLTNKPSGTQIIFADQAALPLQAEAHSPTLLASLPAVTFSAEEGALTRFTKAGWYLPSQLVKCFHYVGWLPVLLGMWWYRRRAEQVPGLWVLMTLCVLMSVVLCLLAVRAGYMSDRHLMLLVMCGTVTAAAALWEAPARLWVWFRRQPWTDNPLPHTAATMALAALLFAGTLASAMPKTLDTLHANRAGHHAAGLWLAAHAADHDIINDEHCWAHYYAGHVFLENQVRPQPPQTPPVRYIVVGKRDTDSPLAPTRQKPPSADQIRAAGGEVVFRWPEQVSDADASVLIYAIGLPRRK